MTPWVQRLLIANVLMFFVQQTAPEGLTNALVFIPQLIIARPWTMVTYMFLHHDFMHILFNMMGLYFFGSRVEMRLGPERFFALYFVAGISGALMSFVFQDHNAIIGASAGVFGVMLAFARFWPRDQIFIWGIIPIEARWLVGISTLIALYGARAGGGGVAHFAHLGGFVGAFFYLIFLERNHGAKRFKRQATAVAITVDATLGNWKKVDRGSIHSVNKDEVNRILDKISASGIGSLTPQERLFLSNFVPPDDRKPILPS
ncbi:MAG: rhomboid family intramembrane serine protease [bacterium]